MDKVLFLMSFVIYFGSMTFDMELSLFVMD